MADRKKEVSFETSDFSVRTRTFQSLSSRVSIRFMDYGARGAKMRKFWQNS